MFKDDDMVLVRKPGLHSKMGEYWQGPFQVVMQVSPVTYRVAMPDRASTSKVLHCNLWHNVGTLRQTVLYRVAVISENDD